MAIQYPSALRKAPRSLDMTIPARRELFAAVHCPFAERINPHAAAAQAGSLEWLARLGLVTESTRLSAIAKARLTTLVAGFYPCAGLEQLKLASDYVCWAFALDDIGDETAIGERPARLTELFDRFERVLLGDTPAASASALERGLHEVVQRVAAFANARQMVEFLEGNRAYFGGMLWEANNRAHSLVPEEGAYLTFRPAAGAVPSFFALIEPLEGIALAPQVREHAAVSSLSRSAGGIICWSNDLLSYEKERAHGDFHNLVMVYEHHRRLLPGAAAAQAIATINAEIRHFVLGAASLPSFGADQDAELTRFVDTLRAVIRITLSWTYDSSRYRR